MTVGTKFSKTRWQRTVVRTIKSIAKEYGYTITDNSSREFYIETKNIHAADFLITINSKGYFEVSFYVERIWEDCEDKSIFKNPKNDTNSIKLTGWSQSFLSLRDTTDAINFCEIIKKCMVSRAKRRE